MPRLIAGHGVSLEETSNYYNNHINHKNAATILTRLDKAELTQFVALYFEKFLQKYKNNKLSYLGIKDFLKLSEDGLSTIPIRDEISELNVDLILSNQELMLFELKSTFDTDNGKTKDELTKMMRAFVAVGDRPKKPYFGVISNNKGYKVNGEWKGRLASFISKDLILIEDKLWSLLAPEDISFNDFIELFRVQYSSSLSFDKE